MPGVEQGGLRPRVGLAGACRRRRVHLALVVHHDTVLAHHRQVLVRNQEFSTAPNRLDLHGELDMLLEVAVEPAGRHRWGDAGATWTGGRGAGAQGERRPSERRTRELVGTQCASLSREPPHPAGRRHWPLLVSPQPENVRVRRPVCSTTPQAVPRSRRRRGWPLHREAVESAAPEPRRPKKPRQRAEPWARATPAERMRSEPRQLTPPSRYQAVRQHLAEQRIARTASRVPRSGGSRCARLTRNHQT